MSWHRLTRSILASAICVASGATAGAQTPTAQGTLRPAAALTAALPTFAAIAAAGLGTEVTVRWTIAPEAPGQNRLVAESATTLSAFQVLGQRAIDFTPVRERDPRLSEDDVVVVAVDSQGREVAWQRLKDPRLVRSEQPTASGELTGQRLQRAVSELVVVVPAGIVGIVAVELRVYEPRWNGTEFLLRLAGTFAFSRS